MDKTELAVVGGGAAGLAAAVMAARAGIRTTVLEKQPRVGEKAFGHRQRYLQHHQPGCRPRPVSRGAGGVCPSGPGRLHAGGVFAPSSPPLAFPARAGRTAGFYPLCCQAAAVLTCLRLELQARGAVERCGAAVECIVPEKAGFTLCGGGEELRARFVLLAAGGAAAPALGGGTGSYALAEALGHARTPLFPSIVQLRTDTAFIRAVKGLRVEGEAALLLDGRELLRERGEILFTEYGLSGPAVMQISRPAADWERKKRGRLEVELNLLPGWTEAALRNHLAARRSLPGRTLEEALTGLLQSRLGQTVLRAAGIGPLTRPAASLTDTGIGRPDRGYPALAAPGHRDPGLRRGPGHGRRSAHRPVRSHHSGVPAGAGAVRRGGNPGCGRGLRRLQSPLGLGLGPRGGGGHHQKEGAFMIRLTGVRVPLSYTEDTLRRLAAEKLRIPREAVYSVRPAKRAVDARHKNNIVFSMTLEVEAAGEEAALVRRCSGASATMAAPYVIRRAAVRPAHPPVVVEQARQACLPP